MILVRHGQSKFNELFTKTRKDPGIEDPSITSLGKEQIKGATRILNGRRITRLVSSPYRRARGTTGCTRKPPNHQSGGCTVSAVTKP